MVLYVNNISFEGCCAPYTKNGVRVTPIAQNPSDNEIQTAISCANNSCPIGAGLNGSAFYLGQDLVVKKYSRNQGAKREISVLDKMYDKGISIPNIQQGKYAFSLPNDETYLVSTKISGTNPNPYRNRYNEQNLSRLMKVISDFDLPIQNQNANPDGYFPYSVAMHYDLHAGNINMTQDDAGIFDLEFLQFEDLSDRLQHQTQGRYDCDCNFSDIPGLIGNLRSFEYRALVPYMLKISRQEADELFKNYIQEKAEYHYTQGSFYKAECEKTLDSNPHLSKLTGELARKELAHASMLAKADKDVVKSEKIKIQMAHFIYVQSQFERTVKSKFNMEQIIEYNNNACRYFDEMLANSSCEDERIYYQDCVDLMKNWRGVISWMNWQSKEPSFDMFNRSKKPVDELTDEEFHEIQNRYKEHKQNHELFNAKQLPYKLPVIYDFD